MITEFNWIVQFEYVLRLVLSVICGAIIGFERKNRAKEAGIRTHCLVSCGAALLMIVSKYAFFDVVKAGLIEGAEIKLDPSRVASGIASGIGFLGAGMIFMNHRTITGLTTAAGVWATSGVGMALGGGMYLIGVASTLIIVISQIVLHRNFKWLSTPTNRTLTIRDVDDHEFLNKLKDYLTSRGISSIVISAEKNNESGTRNYSLSMEITKDISEDDILSFIPYECSITAD